MTERIWITGAYGRLGKALNELLDRRQVEILNTDIDDLDVTNPVEVANFGDRNRPDAIINCAALTDLKQCEQNPERAFQVNFLGARNVAIAARKIGARLVQLSTDDVFDGNAQTPYTEFDQVNPGTVYGKSKLAGEMTVREFAPKHFIVRSSWIYGQGDNYVKAILEKSEHQNKIEVGSDQTGSPTSATELAKTVLHLISTQEYGLYHACCEGSCTRLEFAQEVFHIMGKDIVLVPVSANEDSLVRERPPYCALDDFMLRITGTYRMPHWKFALSDYLEEMKRGRNAKQ